MELLRTPISVPGNRQGMLEKAATFAADCLVLDLEDSVPAAEKESARALVRDSIATLKQAGQRVFVRVNPLSSGYGGDDLEAVVIPGTDGINLPKPGTAADVQEAAAIIARLESERGMAPGQVAIIPWVETALGLLNAYQIASASPRVVGIMFGAEDFTLDTGMVRSEGGEELLFPRTMVVIAAKAAGVIAIDTPYGDFRDTEGLVRETQMVRRLGYEGKFLIHPSQIGPVNQLMRPSAEEIAHAQRVVEAFAAAEAQGFASTSLEGKMIDIPIARRAQRLLDAAAAIARREGDG